MNFDNNMESLVAEQFGEMIKCYESGNPIVLANKAFVMSGSEVKDDIQEIYNRNFKSDITALDFMDKDESADGMNRWVANVTRGVIQKIISPSSLTEDIRLILINAIYFKGLWETKFERSTEELIFRNSATESERMTAMTVTSYFRVQSIKELDAKVIEIPYSNAESYSMLLVLPNALDGLAQIEKNISNFDLWSLSRSATKSKYELIMPIFNNTDQPPQTVNEALIAVSFTLRQL